MLVRHIKVCSLHVQQNITQREPRVATTVYILQPCIRQRYCVVVICTSNVLCLFVFLKYKFLQFNYHPGENLFIGDKVANGVSTNTSYLQQRYNSQVTSQVLGIIYEHKLKISYTLIRVQTLLSTLQWKQQQQLAIFRLQILTQR